LGMELPRLPARGTAHHRNGRGADAGLSMPKRRLAALRVRWRDACRNATQDTPSSAFNGTSARSNGAIEGMKWTPILGPGLDWERRLLRC
jgi:hypothetical protein